LSSRDGAIDLAPGVELRVEVDAIVSGLDELLGEAVESLVPARRGRPPRTRARDD
jgi:hypothetical protein